MQPIKQLEKAIAKTIEYLKTNGIDVPPELLSVEDKVDHAELKELADNLNVFVAKQTEESVLKAAGDLASHVHTAKDVMADRIGSASVVQDKLNNHVQDYGNPHNVTAVQIGASKREDTIDVQHKLGSHVQDRDNPHGVTATQIGVDIVSTQNQLNEHVQDKSNPHGITAKQIGAEDVGVIVDTKNKLSVHVRDHDNPHDVTSEQIGSPKLVSDAEVYNLVVFSTTAGEQMDSGKNILDLADVRHTHPPQPVQPMIVLGGGGVVSVVQGDLTATAPLVFDNIRHVIGGAADISIPMATALVDGYLSAIDWNIFNNKQNALVFPLAPNLGGTGVANAGTLTNANNTIITGGGTLALGGFTATVPITGATAMGAGTLTSVTVNDVTVAAHTHAITLAPGLLGNGAMQYQTIVTGAAPFAPVYSGFLLDGTTGGKTVFKVTNTKTLTLTSTGDFNLTVPATGTAALLATANVFTVNQTIIGSADAVQLLIKANGTQTTYLTNWQTSGGVDLGYFRGDGTFYMKQLGTSANYGLYIEGKANTSAFFVKNVDMTTATCFLLTLPLSTGVADGKAFGISAGVEAFARVVFYSDGKFGCGGGAGTRDVFLGRSSANNWLISSNATATGVAHLTITGGLIVNEAGAAAGDFRVEGDTATSLLFTDASIEAVQIGTTTAGAIADFRPAEIVFNDTGLSTLDFRVESDNYDAIFVDASNDSIMIMSNIAGKVGFYAKTAVAQQAHIVDADGSLADATTKINAILVRLETLGLIASA